VRLDHIQTGISCDAKTTQAGDVEINAAIALVQQQLKNQELPWQALLDSAGEGIWGVDLAGDCTFVNRAALLMIGFTSEELVGHNMHDMLHHHYPDGSDYPKDECVINDVFWNKKPFANRIDHVFRKDGSMFWAEMSAQPIAEGDEVHGAVVTFRDITRSRLAEEALRRNEKLAAVGQLASSIAHEINNPLEAVINLLYLVRTADSFSDVRAYAMLAEAEVARMADITLQTLRFHRQQTAAAPVDFNDTIPAVLRLYSGRFLSRNVIIKNRLRPTPSAMLLEGDIRQVLNNLIRNAYDAMPDGGHLCLRLRPANSTTTGEPGIPHHRRRLRHGVSAAHARTSLRTLSHQQGCHGDRSRSVDLEGHYGQAPRQDRHEKQDGRSVGRRWHDARHRLRALAAACAADPAPGGGHDPSLEHFSLL